MADAGPQPPHDEAPTQGVARDEQPTVVGLVAGQRRFGRYVLASQVGRGGMGVVWRARDETLETDVALKFLPETVADDPAAVNDLKRETRRSLQLTHPHIVRIFDFVQDPSAAAIAMEYVEGATLTQRRLARPGQVFEPAELVDWVVQLGSALDYAHNKARVVHRDLKPANLMVDAQGELKVTDFGISAALVDSNSRLSKVAGTSGTPVYMSPQQMMGEKPAVTDDIYALGTTLYELLTGKPPFYSGNIELQVQGKVPPSITSRREELGIKGSAPISPDWEKIIAACVAKDPALRPQSCGDVARRLLASAHLTSSGKYTLRTAHQPGVAAPVATDDVPTPRTERVKARPPKSLRPLYAAVAVLVLSGLGAGYYFQSYVPDQRRRVEVARLEAESKAAAARGGIIVRTEPAGAEVSVVALEQGPSPLRIKEAKPGKYPVNVRLAGYEDWSGAVEVKADEFAELSATLVRSTGGATITSDPIGLSFTLSTKETTERGVTPATLTKLPTGPYTLKVMREGWPDETQTVTVERGEAASAQAEFAGGNLEITSEPSGAEVYADGKKVGVTPLSYRDVKPQSYAYEFRLKGHTPANVRGDVTARHTAQADAKLKKIRGAEVGQAWTIPDLDMVLQPIRPGTFVMGDARDGGTPLVTITQPFWLGKTEVTQREWEAVIGNNPSSFKGASLPVENVSWEEAMEFCRKLTARERAADRLPEELAYTLPTEAQWEYACRAGTTGGYAGEPNAMAWYFDNSQGTPHPVGQKQPNTWGLHDMHGNVWEWCVDWIGPLPSSRVNDPRGPGLGDSHIVKSGSWRNTSLICDSAYRQAWGPSYRFVDLGFRVALSSVQ